MTSSGKAPQNEEWKRVESVEELRWWILTAKRGKLRQEDLM